MDYINKTKKFIAFINKDGRDRFWINGNITNDEEEPRVFQYDTKEQKQTAMEIAEHLVCWGETCDIEAVILQRVDEPFPLFTKKDSAALVEKYEKIYAEKKKKQLEDNMNKRKKNHEGNAEVDGESCDGSDRPSEENGIHSNPNSDDAKNDVSPSSKNTKPNEKTLINNENTTNSSGNVVPAVKSKRPTQIKNSGPVEVKKVGTVEQKRSPLELKPKIVEKPKKEQLAPSKPVTKSKLNKLIKEK